MSDQTPHTAAGMTAAPAWASVVAHAERLGRTHLREMFAADPERVPGLTVSAVGIRADLSKQRLDTAALASLVALARERGVEARRAEMLTGEHINITEDRAVLHTALRLPRSAQLVVDGIDVVAPVHEVLDSMSAFCDRVRCGEWTGTTGQTINAVVNIGIGGSDLGPVMAYEALRAGSRRDITFRFVSNVDGADFLEKTQGLDPARTLFVVASKTFTTAETMTNARSARDWLLAAVPGADVAKHFVALSTNAAGVSAFGIDTANMFGFWDWVGGRYSIESAIGLSTMLAIGPDAYRQMLDGFHAMDIHFASAPLEQNLPVLMAMIGIWNRNLLGCQTQAVLPYEQYLLRFPAYLQQLTMESNGKHVRLDGSEVGHDTGAVWWGEPGTNGQHSFYQLLHQGTSIIPSDIIAFVRPVAELGDHHLLLLANAVAQASALAFGKNTAEVTAEGVAPDLVPHKVMPGNRPSTFLVLEQMTPFALGTLVALYEHLTFVQGVVWGLDSFDQWGVELGKVLASKIVPMLDGSTAPGLDASTQALVKVFRGGLGV